MAFADWGYDDGEAYEGSWIALILLLAPSVVFNLATFLLLSCSPQLTRSSSSLLVRILCLEDGVYSLCCLLSCVLNLHHSSIYGQGVGCTVQAIYMLFFQLCTGYTLCCVAYNSERKVAGKHGLTQRQVWLTHLVIWLVAALITVLSAVVVQPARVYPSSTFCLVAINELGPALLFWLPGLAVILFLITYRYALLYRYITTRSTELADQYAKSPAAAASQLRQIAAAKRMAAIVASFLLSNLPFALLGLYELISRRDAPAIVTVSAAWLIHLGSMLNPIIYVWLNGRIRAALSDAARRLILSAASVSPAHASALQMTLSPKSNSDTPLDSSQRLKPAPSPSNRSSKQPYAMHMSPSLAGRALLQMPPPLLGSPRGKRRASALTFVMDGGSTRPGSTALVGSERVTEVVVHSSGEQQQQQQPAAETEPLCTLNAPDESLSAQGEGNG